jgi:hypothetical protein
MIQPLRSTSITEISSLLRVDPSLCFASVLSQRKHHAASPLTSKRQVLMFRIKACYCVHAPSMPTAALPVSPVHIKAYPWIPLRARF